MQKDEFHVISRTTRDRDVEITSQQIPPFSMAFQPVVDLEQRIVYAYEALVRSPVGESAASVIAGVPGETFHLFDHACRSRGVELALSLGLQNVHPQTALAVNVNPGAAVKAHSHLDLTCREAVDRGFPLDRLILELVETEQVKNIEEIRDIISGYQKRGVRIAIDDFGSGYSGLTLLAHLKPDIVKLDMVLVQRITEDYAANVVIKTTAQACRELGVTVIAEGVEKESTMLALMDVGITLQQGYLFAMPEFEKLPSIHWPETLKPRVA